MYLVKQIEEGYVAYDGVYDCDNSYYTSLDIALFCSLETAKGFCEHRYPEIVNGLSLASVAPEWAEHDGIFMYIADDDDIAAGYEIHQVEVFDDLEEKEETHGELAEGDYGDAGSAGAPGAASGCGADIQGPVQDPGLAAGSGSVDLRGVRHPGDQGGTQVSDPVCDICGYEGPFAPQHLYEEGRILQLCPFCYDHKLREFSHAVEEWKESQKAGA